MTKIMRTLWDESAELTDEAMASDASVLSDSYTSGDVKDVTETIEGGNQEADDFNEKNDGLKKNSGKSRAQEPVSLQTRHMYPLLQRMYDPLHEDVRL